MSASTKTVTLAHSGVLLKNDIQSLDIICEKSDDGSFKPSSYDLRIGDEYLNTDGEQTAIQIPLHDCDVVVPPLGSVIVSTYEVVRIPKNVIGKFNLRIRLAVKGLFVQMGTQVEPYYHGRLFATLHNISADPIRLALNTDTGERERLFTIEFFYTNGDAEEPIQFKKYLQLRDFIKGMAFTKSPMATLLEKSKKSSEQYSAAKVLLDSAQENLKKEVSKETATAKDELKNWMQTEVKASVGSELREQSKGWRKLAFEFGLMGVGVVVIATILPILFGFAMEWSRSVALSEEERTMGSRISTIETDLETVRNTSDGNGRVEALSSRLAELNVVVLELQQQNAEMKRQIEENYELVYNVDQNPGANPDAEE